MEDNDEDGDEDGFEEALETAEKQNKAKAQDKKAATATPTPAHEEVQSSAHPPLPPVTAEGDKVTSAASSSMAPVPLEGAEQEQVLSLSSEDDLVSAMQSASISGSRISDMPTP